VKDREIEIVTVKDHENEIVTAVKDHEYSLKDCRSVMENSVRPVFKRPGISTSYNCSNNLNAPGDVAFLGVNESQHHCALSRLA
jgi:hypothetical protein